MASISYWATKDLSVVGRDDDKARHSIYHLTFQILAGIYYLRHINVSDVFESWRVQGVYSEKLSVAVLDACLEFESELEREDCEHTVKSSISDLLAERRLPELPSTLRHNDYVDIEVLKQLLRRRFNETD